METQCVAACVRLDEFYCSVGEGIADIHRYAHVNGNRATVIIFRLLLKKNEDYCILSMHQDIGHWGLLAKHTWLATDNSLSNIE